MAYENILVEKADGIAKVFVNRPKVMNALNAKTIAEMTELFHELKEDEEVLGIILTGSGEKSFVAGADITELAKMNASEAKKISETGQNLFNLIENLGKPVVAAINGFALGGGLELAMACSFRYASANARMGQPEINLGLIPGYGGTQRLPRITGRGPAMEMLLTGDMIDAEEAFRMGLVNKVLPQEELLPAAEKTLGKIAAKSPLMMRFLSQAVNKGLSMTLKDGLALEANLFSQCADSEDMKEGTDAFLNKRKPKFKGC
ncbi:MAG: enoyl-CoA hydratase-related protein [Planctomycetota bacterium]|jgi:enoyl-CoA hydratase